MSITSSLIIYLITIMITVFAFHFADKSQKKLECCSFLLFAISIPVLIAGVRYSIGADYFTYIDGFERIKFGYSVRWEGLEYGYTLLNMFLVRLGVGAQSIMFASSLLMMSFVSKALLNKHEVISVGFGALTFMLLFYQASFNIVRLMIAVSIFVYNIVNIENRKLIKYLLFTVLAASFHISALATLPIYWLYNSLRLDKSFLKRLLVYGAVVVSIIYFNQILDWILSQLNYQNGNYYEQYIGNSDKSIAIAIKIAIVYLPILIPGVIFYEECQQHDEHFLIYYSLTVIGVIIAVFATFKAAYVDRISQYFIIASVMVVAEYFSIFKKNKKYLSCFILICYLFSYWIYNYFIVKDHGTVPYQWIL